MRVPTAVIALILSSLMMLANRLAQPYPDLKPKVFVLGLSKTGTTSIGNALALLKYKRIGWKDIRSRHLVHTYLHGDLSALWQQTAHFDAFEDLPWSFVYREMSEAFPDSKFVLSLRRDEETWLRSMRRHMGRGEWEPAVQIYGATGVDGNEEKVLQMYRDHTAAVREFFKDMPERYVELVVDDDSATNWDRLCSVAECPEGKVPDVPFPKSNTAGDWKEEGVLAMLSWTWGWTVTRLEEAAEYYYYEWHRLEPVKNVVLEMFWHPISVFELAICNLYYRFAVANQEPLPLR